jgi:hypothetical protein
MGETLNTDGSVTQSGGSPGNYGHVDPNGLQTASTGAAALGIVALVADSGSGDNVGSFLNLGTQVQEVATAGLTLHSLANMGLFSIGILLVALSVLLNIASLTIRWQYALSVRHSKKKGRESVLESGAASNRVHDSYPMADQNRRR